MRGLTGGLLRCYQRTASWTAAARAPRSGVEAVEVALVLALAVLVCLAAYIGLGRSVYVPVEELSLMH